MSKKKKKAKKPAKSIKVQRVQGVLFKLRQRCDVALALEPENLPKQKELEEFTALVDAALEECRANRMPALRFITDARN